MPSIYKYSPSQWLWGKIPERSLIADSGAHQIVWAHRNVSQAIVDLRGMLRFQQPDGRIPEIINWRADKESYVWKILTRLQYSRITHVDLTQMPVLPYR